MVDENRAGLALAAQIIAAAVTDWPESFAARLAAPFPWIALLPVDEREQFADELVTVARACAAVSAFEPLATAIHAWQSTAEAHARGYTREEDLDWLDEPAPVVRPEE